MTISVELNSPSAQTKKMQFTHYSIQINFLVCAENKTHGC